MFGICFSLFARLVSQLVANVSDRDLSCVSSNESESSECESKESPVVHPFAEGRESEVESSDKSNGEAEVADDSSNKHTLEF